MICHLAGLAAIVIPFVGGVIVPLIIWRRKKDQYPFCDEHGKEAVNFQISILMYAIVLVPLCFAFKGFILLPAVVYIFDLIFLLIAAVKARRGKHYRYPLTIRFIKTVGTVNEKNFRPPSGKPAESWCYLKVELESGEVITIRLHKKHVNRVKTGDRIRFSKPWRKNKPVKRLKVLEKI
jgi:uncharacterized Tic20 family protein